MGRHDFEVAIDTVSSSIHQQEDLAIQPWPSLQAEWHQEEAGQAEEGVSRPPQVDQYGDDGSSS